MNEKEQLDRKSLGDSVAYEAPEHGRWWRAGRRGEGRIVRRGQNLRKMRGLMLAGAEFTECDLSGLLFYLNDWDEIRLVDCVVEESRFVAGHLHDARLLGCSFLGSRIEFTHFSRARVERCDFEGCLLDRAYWNDCVVDHASFRGAKIPNNLLDGARFSECDFRGAQLCLGTDPSDPPPHLARAQGTRFVRCDFRGANLEGLRLDGTVFESCAFYGVRGAPTILSPCTFEKPDLSPGFDGSEIVSADVLMAEWGAGRVSPSE